MNLLLIILGQLWALPNTIVSLVYLSAMWLFKQIKPTGRTSISIVWEVIPGSRLEKHMIGKWKGWSSGANIIINPPLNNKIIAHENRHVLQQMVLGISFIFLYLLEMLRIKLFTKGKPYYDNHFEVAARTYANIVTNQNSAVNK